MARAGMTILLCCALAQSAALVFPTDTPALGAPDDEKLQFSPDHDRSSRPWFAHRWSSRAFASSLAVPVWRSCPTCGHNAPPPPPPPPPSPPPRGGGGGDPCCEAALKRKIAAMPDNWWARLPGGWLNPLRWWMELRQRGPYTRFYINHINPWAKILSYMNKNDMMRLQCIALVGQFSVLLDKSLRPNISQENWWSIRYYSIFGAINIRAILAILRERRPVHLSERDSELYELLFRPNHFSPRQFQTLISKAQWHQANNSALVTEGQTVTNLILLASGQCDVTIGGDQANVIRPGDFIGELEYMQDKSDAGSVVISAPVSVIAKGEVNYVSWSFEDLEALLNAPKNKQILVRIEALLAKDIATKLLETDIRHGARLNPDKIPGVPGVK